MEKVCNKVYWRLVERVRWTQICIERWSKALDTEWELSEWENFFTLPFKICRDTTLRAFQWKIVHGILITNVHLKQYGILDSDVCTFCKKTKGTSPHLFYECPVTKQLWVKLINWLSPELQIQNRIDVRYFLILSIRVKEQIFLNS